MALCLVRCNALPTTNNECLPIKRGTWLKINHALFPDSERDFSRRNLCALEFRVIFSSVKNRARMLVRDVAIEDAWFKSRVTYQPWQRPTHSMAALFHTFCQGSHGGLCLNLPRFLLPIPKHDRGPSYQRSETAHSQFVFGQKTVIGQDKLWFVYACKETGVLPPHVS